MDEYGSLPQVVARDRSPDMGLLERFERLAETGTWELDVDAHVVRCSPEMIRLHGMSPTAGDVSMPRMLQLVHPDDRHLILENFAGILRGEDPPELAYRVVHADGSVRHLLLRGVPAPSSGGQRRYCGVALDVTESRTRERRLSTALEREQHAAADLRAADEVKDLFLRALSHDLRTPLTVIEGFASLLVARDESLGIDERRDYAERIRRGARRLHEQLTDLLDLDRLARGVLQPQRQPVDLRQMAADVVEDLNLATRVRVLGEPLVATVDPAHVERILENLIANAARHTPARGSVEVRCEAHEDGALITVDDAGPGVADDLKEEVFNAFFKADPSSPGTGVGLSLVRRFAELHGGRAWIEDRPGGGASFKVLLPSSDQGAPLSFRRRGRPGRRDAAAP